MDKNYNNLIHYTGTPYNETNGEKAVKSIAFNLSLNKDKAIPGITSLPYRNLHEIEVSSLKHLNISSAANNQTHINMTLECKTQKCIVSYIGKLMDVKIIQHKAHFCDSVLSYIIYVYTAIGNVLRWTFIHETWGNNNVWKDGRSRTVFIVGKPLSKGEQLTIDEEFNEHGDIVQGDFIDSYHNLT